MKDNSCDAPTSFATAIGTCRYSPTFPPPPSIPTDAMFQDAADRLGSAVARVSYAASPSRAQDSQDVFVNDLSTSPGYAGPRVCDRCKHHRQIAVQGFIQKPTEPEPAAQRFHTPPLRRWPGAGRPPARAESGQVVLHERCQSPSRKQKCASQRQTRRYHLHLASKCQSSGREKEATPLIDDTGGRRVRR